MAFICADSNKNIFFFFSQKSEITVLPILHQMILVDAEVYIRSLSSQLGCPMNSDSSVMWLISHKTKVMMNCAFCSTHLLTFINSFTGQMENRVWIPGFHSNHRLWIYIYIYNFWDLKNSLLQYIKKMNSCYTLEVEITSHNPIQELEIYKL